jgi:transcriptional regulator with XRE-family HTH domain
MDAVGVAERVRTLREARGWSQRTLDREAGLSHAYVSKLEAGQIPNFGMTQLRKIADALGVRVEELVSEVEEGGRAERRVSALEAEVEDIRVNLLALGELDRGALQNLRGIVVAMKESAERRYKEERRAERRRRKVAGQARPGDQEA